ncbi:hypothetical protein NDU88_000685 [Pleurodeles waltl]|uniref:Uncharacterized protein n=1 Tax=Pleurodeles waltl TaxID=8319 RepID=A0AAV7KMQ3_PLEWA|nr:hypothetical protein NDU88_000685 [Pleurodeles waltl]
MLDYLGKPHWYNNDYRCPFTDAGAGVASGLCVRRRAPAAVQCAPGLRSRRQPDPGVWNNELPLKFMEAENWI